MKKVLYHIALCALALCCECKVTEQAEQSTWNVTVLVKDKDGKGIFYPKYNEDGVLEVDAGQRIAFWVQSKIIPNIFFSPLFDFKPWKTSNNRKIKYTDIFDPQTYSASFAYFVDVGINTTGWYYADDFSPESNSPINFKTVFFTTEKSGKKFIESGSTLRMKESAPRYIVPCVGTNANFSATLRIVSPAHLRNDNVESYYDSKIGFWLPEADQSLWLARTFECVAGQENVTVEFPQIAPDLDDRPIIRINKSLNIPECSVKKSTTLIVERFPCFDPQFCGFYRPWFYQPLPYPEWKLECHNCTDISVPVKPMPGAGFPVLRIRCYANDQVTELDVVRGLNRVYYLSDEVPSEVSIQARVISRAGTLITVGIEALGYLYLSVREGSISFKNGTLQPLDPWQNEGWSDRGIKNMEVVINWTQDMDKIIFHAFQFPSMKLTNVSVDLAPAEYSPGENWTNI